MSERTSDDVVAIAPAKINLYLHVTGRRADGYHLLDSLVAFAGVGDTIDATPAGGLSLSVSGPFAAAVPTGRDNLVLRAAQALADMCGVEARARIHLTKRLPVAAGIGGGSADAAAALKALMALWTVRPADGDLRELALTLGADVPVCLAGHPAQVGGVGEEIARAPALPDCWMVLVNPGVALSTPAVFKRREGPFSPARPLLEPPAGAEALAISLAERGNDLTAAAVALEPVVGTVLAKLDLLPGALLSRMSGSGATCFALFATREDSERGAQRLGQQYPGWWIQPAPLDHG
jgi:4-diphosphocytidyl-2-C-methyl-D-erythritol kinase